MNFFQLGKNFSKKKLSLFGAKHLSFMSLFIQNNLK